MGMIETIREQRGQLARNSPQNYNPSCICVLVWCYLHCDLPLLASHCVTQLRTFNDLWIWLHHTVYKDMRHDVIQNLLLCSVQLCRPPRKCIEPARVRA